MRQTRSSTSHTWSEHSISVETVEESLFAKRLRLLQDRINASRDPVTVSYTEGSIVQPFDHPLRAERIYDLVVIALLLLSSHGQYCMFSDRFEVYYLLAQLPIST
jgi:hypothetical protein